MAKGQEDLLHTLPLRSWTNSVHDEAQARRCFWALTTSVKQHWKAIHKTGLEEDLDAEDAAVWSKAFIEVELVRVGRQVLDVERARRRHAVLGGPQGQAEAAPKAIAAAAERDIQARSERAQVCSSHMPVRRLSPAFEEKGSRCAPMGALAAGVVSGGRPLKAE